MPKWFLFGTRCCTALVEHAKSHPPPGAVTILETMTEIPEFHDFGNLFLYRLGGKSIKFNWVHHFLILALKWNLVLKKWPPAGSGRTGEP